jgi:hypothetical protein
MRTLQSSRIAKAEARWFRTLKIGEAIFHDRGRESPGNQGIASLSTMVRILKVDLAFALLHEVGRDH